MSLLFGGGGSKAKPQFTGLDVQTSTTTVAITQSWGYGRQAPNIIWQDDFQSHKQKQSSGKGGGGGGTSYTYSASFIAAVGWGVFSGCDRVWKDQSKETDFTKLGFVLFSGAIPQAPWGYLTANHPDKALGYPGLGYFAVANYDLAQSNVFPQHSFLMRRPLYNTAPGGVGDADVALVIDDFLNSTKNGVLIGEGALDTASLMSGADATTTGDNAFQTYCTAMGFGFSPELEDQESALDIMDRWTAIFNTGIIWTGYSLKFLPYGPDTITANGVTYLPNFVSRYTLTDDDYIFAEGTDPVTPSRMSPQDVKNSLNMEIKNRNNEYNTEPAPWQDQGLIDEFGPIPDSMYTAHEIKEPAIGAVCAALMGQRNAYQRNEFDFDLPVAFMLLEPGDIVTLNDPAFGPKEAMLRDIEEQDDDSLQIVAKEFNGTVASAGTVQVGGVTNNPIDTGVTASPVNTPMLFQPPPSLTNNSPQVWAAVSGGNPHDTTADPNWGGCDVYLSTDGGASYNKVGTVDNAARMGYLNAGLAAYGSANPDIVNTLKVNVAESAAQFDNATAADAAAGVTLCRIAPDGLNVQEFLSYQNSTLNATDVYWFDHLYRGMYGSTAGAHGSGAQFARLDNGSVFKYTFPLALIGSTIHVKFVSFNIFGNGYEDISTVTDYTITIADLGYGIPVTVPDGTTPTDGDGLVYDGTTGTWVPGGALRLYAGVDGKPTAGQELFDIEMFGDEVFITGFPSNLGSCDVAPTADAVFPIKKNGTTVGNMKILAGATAATWTLASGLTFAQGDRMSFYAPVAQDATLSGVSYTFIGKRT